MARRFERVLLVVLDSVGAGALDDAAQYGDEGANTLAHTADATGGLVLPNLQAFGLGNVTAIRGVPPTAAPRAHWGAMREASAGKDTTTGHWELAGLVLTEPFATFPDGFPKEILGPFVTQTGRAVIGNEAASGTEIIARLGEEHVRTGQWIVYTSADSVFQVAAHEEVVPLDELDRACRYARELLDTWRVGRVISRPFVGQPGAFQRTYNRHDYSMLPSEPTLLDRLQSAGVPTIGLGKIKSIYADRGVSVDIHTSGNPDGIAKTIQALRDHPAGFVMVNLVDFDMQFGHRRDPQGYAAALETFDRALPELVANLGPDTLLALTADHGCDPTFARHTDHTREQVPLLVYADGVAGGPLGTRATFADLGQTVAENFGVALPNGTSFLGEL
jgi:phosphopentomutase